MKKLSSSIFYMLMVISTLVALSDIQLVKASEIIFIKSNGDVEPLSAPILRDGDVYMLTSNIYSDTDGILIQKKNIILDGDGFTLQGSNFHNSKGIMLSGTGSVTVRNMKIKGFGYGFYLSNTSNNIFYANDVGENHFDGFQINYSLNNTINGNNVYNNTRYGVVVYSGCSDNILTENNIQNNEWGIYIYGSSNRIYHNNILNNTQQFYSHNAVNVWDNGYPSGGNYWSNYSGIDLYNGPYQNLAGSDEIGDTPYNINQNNLDRYPLIDPFVVTPEDSLPPISIHNYDGLWHNSDFTITLTATDEMSGVSEIYYKINNSPIKTVSNDGQPLIRIEGANNSLEYWSKDNAGNIETSLILSGIKLDKTAPIGSIKINSDVTSTTSTSVTLTLTFSDATSGVHQVRYSNDGVWDTEAWESPSLTKVWTLTSGEGEKTVYYQLLDNVGNTISSSATITLQASSEGKPIPFIGTAAALGLIISILFMHIKQKKIV